MNKFQRSRLTFQLRSLLLESHQYTKFSFLTNYGPIELKFHVKTPYEKLVKMYTRYFGHMAKMTATPIYGKNPLKICFSRTRNLVTLRLGL